MAGQAPVTLDPEAQGLVLEKVGPAGVPPLLDLDDPSSKLALRMGAGSCSRMGLALGTLGPLPPDPSLPRDPNRSPTAFLAAFA